MPDMIELGREAMRDLRLTCGDYWRQAQIPNFTKDAIMTPSGLEILKIDDCLEVSADVEELGHNSRVLNVSYNIEFPADMRDLPTVIKWIESGRFNRRDTIQPPRFYAVACLFSKLLSQDLVA